MGTNASQLKLPETNQVNKLDSKERMNMEKDSGFKNVSQKSGTINVFT